MSPKKGRKSNATKEDETQQPPRKTRRTDKGKASLIEENGAPEASAESPASDTQEPIDSNEASNEETKLNESNELKTNENADAGEQDIVAPVLSIDIGERNQTLYVQNLNDKIHKTDMKKSLYFLFSSFGHIIDVVAIKNNKMRGQAHVAFADISAAEAALQSLQSTPIFDKPMRIRYARSKSDAVAKLDGTFKAV